MEFRLGTEQAFITGYSPRVFSFMFFNLMVTGKNVETRYVESRNVEVIYR
jgi:hypothetical protein